MMDSSYNTTAAIVSLMKEWWHTPRWLYTCHTHATQLAKDELEGADASRATATSQVRVLEPGLLDVIHPQGHVPFGGSFQRWEGIEYPASVGSHGYLAPALGTTGQASSVWCRHRHPVHGAVLVRGDHQGPAPESASAADVSEVLEILAESAGLDRWPQGMPLRVSVRQFDVPFSFSGGQLARALCEKLQVVAGSPGENETVGHLFVTLWRNQLFWGFGRDKALFTRRMGGLIHYRREDLRYSRAAAKLLEAFEVFGLDGIWATDGHRFPPAQVSWQKGELIAGQPTALDLGAAPGGWTGVLLAKGFGRVFAVDPAHLAEELQGDPRVIHCREKAHELRLKRGSVDLMVCDANWNMDAVVKTVNKLAPCLRSGAAVIVTLKLMGSYQKAEGMPDARQKVREDVAKALELLKKEYKIMGLRQLFHNRHELTAYLHRF